jgi:hypothetical protein
MLDFLKDSNPAVDLLKGAHATVKDYLRRPASSTGSVRPESIPASRCWPARHPGRDYGRRLRLAPSR